MKRIALAFAFAATLLACSSLFAAQRPPLSPKLPGTAPQVFFNIEYPGDTFVQLLGINNNIEIAGYHGATINKGFTYFFFSDDFAPENYPGSVQTQVIGINNDSNTETCGFYIDKAGTNHGFMHNSNAWTNVDFPGTNFNQLLGVNDNNSAAGYYMDGIGDFHPYIYEASGEVFESLTLPHTHSAQATGINDSNVIVGFFLDNFGVSHGWELNGTTLKVLNFPGSTSTQALGINNLNGIVGSFTDTSNLTHGFLYYLGTWYQLDDPDGVGETIVNGIDDDFVFVGFFVVSPTVNTGFVGAFE
jgi:hypothetical protein